MHDTNLGSANQSQFCRQFNPLQIQLYTTWGLDQDTVNRMNRHLWEEQCAICLKQLDKQQQIFRTTFLSAEEAAQEQNILHKPTWQKAVAELQHTTASQEDYFLRRIMLTPGISVKIYETARKFVQHAFEKTDQAMLPITQNLQSLGHQIQGLPPNLQFISCPQWREENFAKLTNYYLVHSFFGGAPSPFEEHLNTCEACKLNKLIVIRDHFSHLTEINELVHHEIAESRTAAEILIIKMLLQGLHQELNQAEPIIKGQLSTLDLASLPAPASNATTPTTAASTRHSNAVSLKNLVNSVNMPPQTTTNTANFVVHSAKAASAAKASGNNPHAKKRASLPELPGFWGQLLIWLLATIVTGTMVFAAVNILMRRGK